MQLDREQLEEVPLDVETVRSALRQRIEVTSLRTAAREVGMSPTGLRGFVDGSDPYVKTVRRARAWFARLQFHGGRGDLADAHAIEVLVAPLSEEHREAAREWLRSAVHRLRRGEPM